jgi:tetratricopeptide (TPR) repeat protein
VDECPSEPPAGLARRRSLARTWFERGEAAFRSGRLTDAERAYICALRLSPHAYTAFNLGTVAERLGDLDLAIDAYETYLRPAAPDAPDRNEVSAALARLQRERTRVQTQLTPAHPDEPRPPGVVTSAPPETVTTPSRRSRRQGDPGPPSAAWRWVGWTAVAVGTAALGGGVAANLLARRDVDSCNDRWRAGAWDDSQAACDSARRMAFGSYVGLAAGGAAVIAGGMMLLLTRAEKDQPTGRLSLNVGAESGVIGWSGRF